LSSIKEFLRENNVQFFEEDNNIKNNVMKEINMVN
jgi:hypothetical protein